VLLSATPPFEADDEHELFKMVVNADIDYKREELEGVSDDAKDLMRKMIAADPKRGSQSSRRSGIRGSPATHHRLSSIICSNTSRLI
jgi:hypothetical protein